MIDRRSARDDHRRRRRWLGASLVVLATAAGHVARATPVLPTGGVVRAGVASISSPGASSLTVTQSSSRAIVDWASFSIGSGATVRFDNALGATLNRVTGGSVSSIDGLMSATGSVYLLNPNGVIVGKSGVVDVGGSFVASTLGLSDSAFLKGGDLTFTGGSTAAVVNLGKVGALGGDVVMIASTVRNAGSITAANGDVGLLAGTQVLVRDQALDGGRFAVKLGGAGTSVTNTGAIAAATAELRADGGDVYALAGDTAGVIRATGVGTQGGRVFLTAGDAGSVALGGTIAARGANGAGGAIETSAGKVTIGAAHIDAGPGGFWLLDPNDLTIDQTAANTIASTLDAGTSVTQQTTASGTAGNGDITVAPNVNLTWTTNAALTLSAYRDIDIGAAATLASSRGGTVTLYADDTGTGVGTVNFGSGATISTGGLINIYFNPLSNPVGSDVNSTSYTNPTDYTPLVIGYPSNLRPYMLVNDVADLQDIQNNVAGSYALSKSIDASATRGWNGGAGFSPIEGWGGSLDGQGHSIDRLFISRPSQEDVGLFSTLGLSADIRSLTLANVDITGGKSTGAIVGASEAGVQNVSVTGQVSGGDQTGGLDGAGSPFLTNVSFIGTVRGGNSTGGLVGDASNMTQIVNGYVGGSVSGGVGVGGLVGLNEGGGVHANGRINNGYATAAVSGASLVGGVVGDNAGVVTGVYASGLVTGGASLGGLFGRQEASGTLDYGYWDSGTTGQNLAIATDGGSTSHVASVGGATGPSPYTAASYAGFDFTSSGPWVIFAGSTRPMLRSEYSTTINTSHQLQLIDLNRSGSYTLAADIDLSATANTSDVWNPAVGFVPIASRPGTADPFTGTLDGQGHTISSLSIASTFDDVGLFGSLGRVGSISNLVLTDATVTGGYYTGALVGDAFGRVTNVRVSGSVNGVGGVGGLIGVAEGGSTVAASVSSAQVTGSGTDVGGLIGVGLGSVVGSWASGTVGGQVDVGGLIGLNNGFISTSYAAGAATSFFTVGGLVGENAAGGFILDAYATGSATGTNDPNAAAALQPFGAGGLVGLNTGQIVEAYASGRVSGAAAGGLVGANAVGGPGGLTTGTIKNSYWDVGTTGQTAAYTGTTSQPTGAVGIGGATGPSPYARSTYALDFSTSGPWVIFDGATRPLLRSEYATTITNGHQLQLIDLNRAGAYTLATDIDLSATSDGTDVWNPAVGFVPIASRPGAADPFVGRLDGLGHTISNLTITSTYDNIGLFGNVGAAGSVRNLILSNVDIKGGNTVGALVGLSLGLVDSVSVSGLVAGKASVGGLVGSSLGTLSNDVSSATVAGGVGCDGCQFAGGLVGYADGFISGSSATGAVSGYQYVGGLAGRVDDVSNSYATGKVSGTYHDIGGLVGQAFGLLQNDYASGNVSGSGDGSTNIGGLVGHLNGSGTISSSYADGDVLGLTGVNVGGLVGTSDGTIQNAYATGAVEGAFGVGGLVGLANTGHISQVYASGNMYIGLSNQLAGPHGGLIGYTGAGTPTLTNAYWDASTTTMSTAVAPGYTLAQSNVLGIGTYTNANGVSPFLQATYAGFDFSSSGFWVIIEGYTRPLLRSEASTTIVNGHQLQLIALNLAGRYTLGADIYLDELSAPGGVWNIDRGFAPIGSPALKSGPFTGSLDGQGHAITGLQISDRLQGSPLPPSSVPNDVGLFGVLGAAGRVSNLNLFQANVSGGYYTGVLIGDNYGTVSNVGASGFVTGFGGVGGLIGVSEGGSVVTKASASVGNGGSPGVVVDATGDDVGGLIGVNLGTLTSSTAGAGVYGHNAVGGLVGLNIGEIIGSNAAAPAGSGSTLSIRGQSSVGGLVGINTGSVSQSAASATVIGLGVGVGGLVGVNNGSVATSFATGDPSTPPQRGGGVVSYGQYSSDAGGLIGDNAAAATVKDSYATNASSGAALVGRNYGSVTRAYATGAASAGIATLNDGVLLDTFWNVATTGTNTGVAGGTGSNVGVLPIGGSTSLDPLQASGYPSFDFAKIWTIQAGVSPPTLRSAPGQ